MSTEQPQEGAPKKPPIPTPAKRVPAYNIEKRGDRLYQAAGEPKELWFEPKVGHASFDGALPGEYERRVTAFFDKHLAR